MNEDDFGRSIKARLDAGSRQVNGIVAQRLEQARLRALAQVRSAERETVMSQHPRGGTAVLGRLGGDDHQRMQSRTLFVGLALIAAMAGMAYWQQATEEDGMDQGLLDAKMLSSELPLNTFMHPDFKEWVNSER